MKTMSATLASKEFGRFIDAAQREPVLLTKKDRPVAVTVSVADWEELVAMRIERGVAAGLADAAEGRVTEMTDEAIEQRLAQDYLEANSRFHLLLYGACGNPVLLRSIESLWLQIGPFFNRLFTGADLSLRLNDFHEEAFAAIEAGDAKAARQAMEQDLIYFARFLLNLLELEQRPVPAR